ncbi:response regulator transcription factor [Leucothrix arctica]|uniref:Response regulatory domain-containing protein n=1 Tax=Leucothrix arctica TaxID=1481894 RepID=A0A317C849_9GAMM|nr:response regulator [Leucothrix arctica]PWQ94754.1 hypothetical protein DKT75_15830 [Leucothrix arctica]
MNALIIEPSDVVRTFLREIFEKAGFDVDTPYGEEGLYIGVHDEYQFIICNAWLFSDTSENYTMSGLAAIRVFRNEGVNCPILMYSARISWDDLLAGYMAGTDDYIRNGEGATEDSILLRARQLMAGEESAEKSTDISYIRQKMQEEGELKRIASAKILDHCKADRVWLPYEVEEEWLFREKSRQERIEARLRAVSQLSRIINENHHTRNT